MTTAKSFVRRDAVLDPLLLAAAAASGPHLTRNHYHHDFFPALIMPQSEAAWDWSNFTPNKPDSKKRLTYVSRQAPRRQRLQLLSAKENAQPNPDPKQLKKRPSESPSTRRSTISNATNSSPLQVKCMARTRIPTPHGPIFLHLYHNNWDHKEHLAFVVDPAQLSDSTPIAPPIRSRSLDAVWSDSESDMDRIIRGAYQGPLTNTSQIPSQPVPDPIFSENHNFPPPLIRIHSECFTGETAGSIRCDCGEQLDEAIRQISQPVTIPSAQSTIPGRGALIYLRQEGRGIGLLSKIRAYNLQDMGHDTVTANLLLGHKADERGYEIAAAILRDLGLGDNSPTSEGVRILTNNPAKMQALDKEGIRIVERLPMVPRSWQLRKTAKTVERNESDSVRIAGADLDKYMLTKVQRMGHMLPLWMEDE